MYEFILALIFVCAFLFDKFTIMQSLNFMMGVIVYFLHDITAIDLITYKVSMFLLIVVSGAYMIINAAIKPEA